MTTLTSGSPLPPAPPATDGAGHRWLDWARDATDVYLRARVGGLNEQVRRVIGYHFGWWDEHGAPLGAGWGKAVRPTLVLLSARATGADPAVALRSAAAVQLTHDFSLLHDDIIDADTMRRHRATAWRTFGIPAALLAGDAMLVLANSLAVEEPDGGRALELLNGAVQTFLASQFEDVGFEQRTDVSVDECTAMARGKTGALIGAACAMGCLAGGGTADQVEHLLSFGTRLGLAFQHTDDLLGIWGDPQVTGKPVGADVRSRKKSLPVVAALTSGTSAADELAALYRETAPAGPAEVERTTRLLEEAGGRTWTAARADSHLAGALGHLRAAGLTPQGTTTLEHVADLLVHRDH